MSAGRFPTVPFCLESKRFVVSSAASLPARIQPKLPEGLSSQDCTSATICGFDTELHVLKPMPDTDAAALSVPEKSPPAEVQKTVLENRWIQVASPVVAVVPAPSSPSAFDVPSPQSASSRWSLTTCKVPFFSRDRRRVRTTPVIVEPGGTFPATSKAITARRIPPSDCAPVPFVLPTKKYEPAPLLTLPVTLW
jgi:hypothetical protein